jgi:hypothetical protein
MREPRLWPRLFASFEKRALSRWVPSRASWTNDGCGRHGSASGIEAALASCYDAWKDWIVGRRSGDDQPRVWRPGQQGDLCDVGQQRHVLALQDAQPRADRPRRHPPARTEVRVLLCSDVGQALATTAWRRCSMPPAGTGGMRAGKPEPIPWTGRQASRLSRPAESCAWLVGRYLMRLPRAS